MAKLLIKTEVEDIFPAKKASEAGNGVQAYVHTLVEGKVKLTCKIVRKNKKIFGVPPSSKVGDDWFANFLFKDKEIAQAWSKVAVDAFNAQ